MSFLNHEHIEVSLRDGVTDYTFIPRLLLPTWDSSITLIKEEEVNTRRPRFMRLTKGIVQ